MGLLKLADDNPDVDFYEYRDQHYYNKYEYRARFNLVGVRYTWYIENDSSADYIVLTQVS